MNVETLCYTQDSSPRICHREDISQNARTTHKTSDLPQQGRPNPICQHVVYRLQNPNWKPKRRTKDRRAIIPKQRNLKNRRFDICLLAVSQISNEVSQKAFVEAVVEILWVELAFEDEVFGA